MSNQNGEDMPVITENMLLAIMSSLNNPPKNKRKIKIISPYCCKNIFTFSKLCGKNLNKIQDPSSGGIGKRLKIAKIIFIQTIKENIKNNPGWASKKVEGIILKSNPKTKAIARFEAGPAIETFNVPHFWSRKL